MNDRVRRLSPPRKAPPPQKRWVLLTLDDKLEADANNVLVGGFTTTAADLDIPVLELRRVDDVCAITDEVAAKGIVVADLVADLRPKIFRRSREHELVKDRCELVILHRGPPRLASNGDLNEDVGTGLLEEAIPGLGRIGIEDNLADNDIPGRRVVGEAFLRSPIGINAAIEVFTAELTGIATFPTGTVEGPHLTYAVFAATVRTVRLAALGRVVACSLFTDVAATTLGALAAVRTTVAHIRWVHAGRAVTAARTRQERAVLKTLTRDAFLGDLAFDAHRPSRTASRNIGARLAHIAFATPGTGRRGTGAFLKDTGEVRSALRTGLAAFATIR